MIRAIFLDFDGVILESVDVKTEAFALLFKDFPEHVDQIVRYHLDNTGVSRFDKFRYIYRNILKKELSDEKFIELCDAFEKLVFQKVIACDYVTGIQTFIHKYNRTYDLFIVSATPHEEIRLITKHLNLWPYFKRVLGSPKPKGHWVKEIMEKSRYKAEECVFIGDALSDYEAANLNGIQFIGRVRDSFDDIFKDFPVNICVEDFKELDLVIERLSASKTETGVHP